MPPNFNAGGRKAGCELAANDVTLSVAAVGVALFARVDRKSLTASVIASAPLTAFTADDRGFVSMTCEGGGGGDQRLAGTHQGPRF